MNKFRIVAELKKDLAKGMINVSEYRNALKQLHSN